MFDGTRYLTLFGFEKYNAKIKLDSYDSLPIEKVLTLDNVIILIKSYLN